MKRALDVAYYFLERGRENPEKDITPLKLQKLLYYAQAWSLAFLGRPLFAEVIEAWKNGPVVYAVWSMYQGNQPITVAPCLVSSVRFDQDEARVLQEVWIVYGSQTAESLRDLTHKEYPWISARCGLAPEEKSRNPILHEDMMKYYQTIVDHGEEPNCLKIPVQVLDPQKNVALGSPLPSNSHESFDGLSNLVQSLQALKPPCRSEQQRELARKALFSLRNRTNENVQDWANNLANDVADTVD